MTQSLIFVSVVDHEEQSQLLLRPLNSARPAQNTGQTRRKKDIVSLKNKLSHSDTANAANSTCFGHMSRYGHVKRAPGEDLFEDHSTILR